MVYKLGFGFRLLGILVVLSELVLLSFSCSHPAKREPLIDSSLDLVWPQPPDKARIKLVKVVKRPSDVGIRPSFFKRVAQAIFGGKAEGELIAPLSIYPDPSLRRLYITDPGERKIVLYDIENSRSVTASPDWIDQFYPVDITQCWHKIFVSDSLNGKIFIFDKDLRFIDTIENKDLKRPVGLNCTGWGELVVVDSYNATIFAIDSEKKWRLVVDKDAGLNHPTFITTSGNIIYVSDTLNFRVKLFDRGGRFIKEIGLAGSGSGLFNKIKGLAIDNEKHIFVVESLFDTVQIFDQKGRYLLSFGKSGRGPGEFLLPVDISIRDNFIFVADTFNSRLQIFKYVGDVKDDRAKDKDDKK